VIILIIKNRKLSEKELSQIFNVVKHPLRRGILKLLSNSPQSYTMILKSLEIPESSILNYHLREMDDLLINKDDCGKYILNEIGEICVQLILRVKEKEDIHSINTLQLMVEKLKSTLFWIQIVFLPLLVILALELYLLNIINFGSILEIFTSSVIFSTIFGTSFIIINKELGITLEKKEKIGNYSILFTVWILVQTIFTLI
jgi:hypothetical protein